MSTIADDVIKAKENYGAESVAFFRGAAKVVVDHGWWFPEKGAAELYGWAEANTNILTDNSPPFSPEMGSTNLRGILCKVYKV